MKIEKRTKHNILRITMPLFICVLMCFGMSACGDNSNTEETVEITTPVVEAPAPADNHEELVDAEDDGDEDGSDDEDSDEDSEDSGKYSDTEYAQIYKDCNAEMKKTKSESVDELKEMTGTVSKSKLYDETQSRIDKLREIYDDGKSKMVDAMLASTEDDEKAYKKYFKKMTEAYSDYTRDITSAYMDAF